MIENISSESTIEFVVNPLEVEQEPSCVISELAYAAAGNCCNGSSRPY